MTFNTKFDINNEVFCIEYGLDKKLCPACSGKGSLTGHDGSEVKCRCKNGWYKFGKKKWKVLPKALVRGVKIETDIDYSDEVVIKYVVYERWFSDKHCFLTHEEALKECENLNNANASTCDDYGDGEDVW